MVELPKRKVGIVSCSGEELAEGTVSRLATLKALHELRPDDTVTICLPLFLAGGEGDRAFARFYPTIAVDGCSLLCAARGTEMYSGKPAASIVVHDVIAEEHLGQPAGKRRLNESGLRAVDATAERIAGLVDELLPRAWDRTQGAFNTGTASPAAASSNEQTPQAAGCACQSNLPAQTVMIGDKPVKLVALPLIFDQFRQAGKPASPSVASEILDALKLYNAVPMDLEARYAAAVLHAYAAYCERP